MGGPCAVSGLVALTLPILCAEISTDLHPSRHSVSVEARNGIGWVRDHRVVARFAHIGALASGWLYGPMLILRVICSAAFWAKFDRLRNVLPVFSSLSGLHGPFVPPRLRDRFNDR